MQLAKRCYLPKCKNYLCAYAAARKPNLGKLYEKIGFNKEVISRGRFAELKAAEQRPLKPDEAELHARSAQNAYKLFRDRAALSRSMLRRWRRVAQGRVWTGKDAVSRGLVDAIGGFSRAVAIAKHKVNIPQDKEDQISDETGGVAVRTHLSRMFIYAGNLRWVANRIVSCRIGGGLRLMRWGTTD
ncbi:hypothetical protein RHSIM_Rhsim08G0140500 [Rhododendron simsii]|uniref:Peptidase S49 domain-containing protein n=1 Tax=Rhododendron simsii TaxID=118357 RepID=A0A834GL63_RHOSS|nr:hypothetical protein RHSIM_Rhsim08G0140500 [Rhododendron simsii]